MTIVEITILDKYNNRLRIEKYRNNYRIIDNKGDLIHDEGITTIRDLVEVLKTKGNINQFIDIHVLSQLRNQD